MVLKTRGPLHVELVWIFYHGLSWCDISASSQTSVHFQQLVQLLPLDAAEGQSLLGWTQASTSASAALHRSFFHGFISPRANVPMTVPVKVWRFVHSTRSQLGTLSRTCAGQTSSSDWSTIYVCVCVLMYIWCQYPWTKSCEVQCVARLPSVPQNSSCSSIPVAITGRLCLIYGYSLTKTKTELNISTEIGTCTEPSFVYSQHLPFCIFYFFP